MVVIKTKSKEEAEVPVQKSTGEKYLVVLQQDEEFMQAFVEARTFDSFQAAEEYLLHEEDVTEVDLVYICKVMSEYAPGSFVRVR